VPRSIGGLAAAGVLAVVSAGCSVFATAAAHRQPVVSPAPNARDATVATAAPAGPLTVAAARHLPAGVFYILGGPRAASMNVWEVASSGAQTELTRNAPFAGIDEMGASQAGIVVGDGLYGGEQLGRVTRKGVTWIHPWHRPRVPIYGQGPRITSAGQVLYRLPPGQGTDPGQQELHVLDQAVLHRA
jgi:hypothetical protein